MCLAVPGKVVAIFAADSPFAAGSVEFAGVRRSVNLACVPDVKLGDYVLVHAGVAITCINEAEAARVSDAIEALQLNDEFADEDTFAAEKAP